MKKKGGETDSGEGNFGGRKRKKKRCGCGGSGRRYEMDEGRFEKRRTTGLLVLDV